MLGLREEAEKVAGAAGCIGAAGCVCTAVGNDEASDCGCATCGDAVAGGTSFETPAGATAAPETAKTGKPTFDNTTAQINTHEAKRREIGMVHLP